MANPEHLAILKQGVQAWYRWREECSVIPDLSGAGLHGAELRGVDFRGTILNNSNLSSTNLTNADLRGPKISGANLSDADLSRALLFDALLLGTNLLRTKMVGAGLHGAVFTMPISVELTSRAHFCIYRISRVRVFEARTFKSLSLCMRNLTILI